MHTFTFMFGCVGSIRIEGTFVLQIKLELGNVLTGVTKSLYSNISAIEQSGRCLTYDGTLNEVESSVSARW